MCVCLSYLCVLTLNVLIIYDIILTEIRSLKIADQLSGHAMLKYLCVYGPRKQ